MTEAEEERKAICEQCEKHVYEVLPNMFMCAEANNTIVAIIEVVGECPLGKW